MTEARTDHDGLFKQLLTTFFFEFIDLFLPEVATYLERGNVEFLDKEVFTDAASDERHEVDLLAKVRFRDADAFFLIHVENQATAQEDFAARMFRYFARLVERFRIPVYPVAILSYDVPSRPEPDHYIIRFPDRQVLDFSFHAIQLNRLNWRDFLRQPNPVAAALMVKMNVAADDRPRLKAEIMRMIARLRLGAGRSAQIRHFMENYLALTAEENARYTSELDRLNPNEREIVMTVVYEWDRAATERGIAEGRHARGVELSTRMLVHRFGPAAQAISQRIVQLSDAQLDDFAIALLNFASLSDAERWLTARA